MTNENNPAFTEADSESELSRECMTKLEYTTTMIYASLIGRDDNKQVPDQQLCHFAISRAHDLLNALKERHP